MTGREESGRAMPRIWRESHPLRTGRGEHEEHRQGNREDRLYDGGLQLEEDLVAQEEGKSSRDGQQDRIRGDKGICRVVFDQRIDELRDPDAKPHGKPHHLAEKCIGGYKDKEREEPRQKGFEQCLEYSSREAYRGAPAISTFGCRAISYA